jgi:hypothetical protein
MADQPPATGTPSPPSAADELRTVTEGIRSRTDLTAKALGGIGTTLVTAIGLTKLGDVFPIPPGFRSLGWPIVAPLAFVGMGIAVGGLTFRFWSASEPVVMASDPEKCTNLDSDERNRFVRPIYDEVAALNGVGSLSAYERRAQRLRRIAARSSDSVAGTLRASFEEIESDVQSVLTRANLVVVRNRAKEAVRGASSVALYALFVASALMFAVGTDKLDSARSQQIAIAKSCGDAAKAGAAAILPAICGQEPPPPPPKPPRKTASQLSAENAVTLAAALQSCEASAAESKLPSSSCHSIRAALAKP